MPISKSVVLTQYPIFCCLVSFRYLLLFQYRRKLCHHGKFCAVASIADAPDKAVDEYLARAAAGEVQAVTAMIQINVEPETRAIAVRIVHFRQCSEGTMVGVAGEDVHDLHKLWRIRQIDFLCLCE